jgi:hypothetical protein
LTGGLNSINVGWLKNTSLAARQTAVISAFLRGGLLVTFPLYPASNNREIMLSTSSVRLKLLPDRLLVVPSASGLGEVDKLDEPGPAERLAFGEVEKADGGGGEEERKGLLLFLSGELAVIVCVVGMLGPVDEEDAFDPRLVMEPVVFKPRPSATASRLLPATLGSSGDDAVGGGGDLDRPCTAAPAAAAPEDTLPLPLTALVGPLPFLAPGVLTSRGAAPLDPSESALRGGMTRLPAMGAVGTFGWLPALEKLS